MNLTTKQQHLPANIEDLKKFVLIGREKLTSVRAEIRAINKMGLAQEVREQKREEASFLADALLDAESKMGELLKETVTAGNPIVTAGKQLPEGITRKQSHQFQKLADNLDLVEEVKAEARENEDLPTRTEVLRKIKQKEMKEQIEEQRKELNENTPVIPGGVFDVIVIDPPWQYEDSYDPTTRRGTTPYPTMNQNELKDLKVPSSDDSVIFLWTTHKFIFDAKELLDLWGFEYRNTLVWDKDKMGMGKRLRLQCEFCLVGIKGKPFWNLTNQRDIIREARREHSRKPESFYEMVDNLCAGRKLDYFAREQREGWETFGNDTEKF